MVKRFFTFVLVCTLMLVARNMVFCRGKGCQVLKGESCSFPLRSHPSMESCAIDL